MQGYVYTVNPSLAFEIEMTENQEETLREEVMKLMDQRSKTWKQYIDAYVFNKLKTRMPKGEPFEKELLDEMKLAIGSMTEKFIFITKVDEYKPKQKTIGESSSELNKGGKDKD